jgi:hypothetical protein
VGEGFSRHDAIHAIASVLSGMMYARLAAEGLVIASRLNVLFFFSPPKPHTARQLRFPRESTMVSAVDPQTRRLVASVPKGDGVEEFDCVADTGRNPARRCQTVTVEFRARALGLRAQTTPERKVGLDTGTRALDGTFGKGASRSGVAFAATLLAAMVPADFDLQLQARHRKLCAIYAHARKRPRAAVADSFSQESVGRNDPCPCGSRKKFKKCCMGKGPRTPGARRSETTITVRR